MLYLGLASLLQIAFLPGFLLLRLFGGNYTKTGTALFSLALSMIANYFLVWGLVTVRQFTQPVMLTVLAAELCVASYMLRHTLSGSYNGSAAYAALRAAVSSFSRQNIFQAVTQAVAVAIAAICVASYIKLFVVSAPQPFEVWDVVNSWQKWAEKWFAGTPPATLISYPQLIPANWAVAYALMGTDLIQMFPKLFMGIFPLAIAGLFIFLWRATREFGYIYAVIAITLVFGNYTWFLASGNVDIPLAFFVLLPLACLVAARSDPAQWRRYLVLGGLFAAGSALVKQSGFIVALSYPVFAYVFVFRAMGIPFRRALIFGIGLAAAYALMLAPFYAIRIFSTENVDLAQGFSGGFGIQQGLGLIERFTTSYMRNHYSMDTNFIILFALCTPSRFWRAVVWFIALPWLVISGIFVGYDARNAVLSMPMFAAAGGMTVHLLISASQQWLQAFMERDYSARMDGYAIRRVWILPVLLLLAVPSLAYLGHRFSDQRLIDRETSLRKKVGYPAINERLYGLAAEGKLAGVIVGNYMFMGSLPELKERFVYDSASDEKNLLSTVIRSKARYLMLMPTSNKKEIDAAVASVGKHIPLTVVFSESGFTLYSVAAKY